MDSSLKSKFTDVKKVEYDILNYVARLKLDPFCSSHVKTFDDRGMPPANVSIAVAKAMFNNFLASQVKECHLREVLDNALVKGSATISEGGATLVSNDGKTVNAPLNAGYFVPQGREDDRLPSWIADSVAFQMTDTVTKDVLGSKGQTIPVGEEKKLHMVEQSFDVDIPPEFSRVPLSNSRELYAFYKDPKIGSRNLVLAHAQMAHKWNNRQLRAVSKGAIPVELKEYVVVESGKEFLPMPSAVMQPGQVCTSEVGFYRYLERHRKLRGADNGGVSPLTSGYYFGSMSRALDQNLWLATDILEMLFKFERDTIIFTHGEVKSTIYAILHANNICVYVIRSGKVKSPYFTVLDPMTWRENRDVANAMFYMSKAIGEAAPTVTRNGLVGQDSDSFSTYMQDTFCAENGGIIRLTHAYLRDYMEKYVGHVYPSVHAHAGHIMLCSVPMSNTPITIAKLFARATLANKYKTAFPVRRVIFGVLDQFRPKVWTTGIKLISGASCEKQTDEIDVVDYGIQTKVLAELDIPPLVFKSTVIATVPVVDLPIIPPPLVHDEENWADDIDGEYDEDGREIKPENDVDEGEILDEPDEYEMTDNYDC